ncbi:IclR family transcriptional regulator [Saccharopolyspora sp. K220]|uniref:IclR family transcriptional regulator n=1 Tax=Saccharopolyspora soli TaxID=2926618 RepID=UPI001F56B171|nr:IclR family transcriptional regulator [Saccharopolyspora soli]MCI2418403.1 IclR family transcriptional regulator [Saccharopolyspora soli]
MATSADRALDLLDEIAARPAPTGLMELATAAGLDKSTASRLLAVLCGRGLVTRDPDTRRYEPGPALLLLATRVLDNSPLRATAHSHLQRLRDASGETVTLQLRVGLQRVCVDGADSSQPVRRVAHIGEANPLYVGVTGKVITAFLPSEQVASVLADGASAGRDMSRLPRELELIRRRGYHASIGDKGVGIAGISAPVLTSRGVIAGLTVSGPHDRWTVPRMEEFAPTLLAAAREVSTALGGR